MTSKAELQLKTAHAIIDAYNKPTLESMMAPRSEDYVHVVRPASLNRPSQGRKEYSASVVGSIIILKDFKMEVYDIINDPASSKAVINAMGIADSAAGPYRNEYAIFLTFNEAGDKVIKEEVFEDSAFTLAFTAKVMELNIFPKH